ncbi:hypothetical protein LCM28_09990 [Salipiger pacificus]|nr:hypothetical protein [Alloyangia pacifica]
MKSHEEIRTRAVELVEHTRAKWSDYWSRSHDHSNPFLRTSEPDPQSLFERVCAPKPCPGTKVKKYYGYTELTRHLRYYLARIEEAAPGSKQYENCHLWLQALIHSHDSHRARHKVTRQAWRENKRLAEREDRVCAAPGCDEVIPASAHARAKFCCGACRVAAHRANKES